MATTGDRDRLVDIMNDVVSRLKRPAPLYGFLPLEGFKYRRGRGLMVVGRAIAKGGWGKANKPLTIDQQRPEGIRAYANELRAWGKEEAGGDEMAWVNRQWGDPRRSEAGEKNYNTATSAFWRVIGRVLKIVDPEARDDPEHWASHLTWSDLYKVSAHGNPTGKLERVQRDGCIQALEGELAEYLPTRVLFLTGLNWASPFLNRIQHDEFVALQTRFVEAWGRIQLPGGGDCVFVVAPHPQGKPENEWTSDVTKAFAEAGSRN